MKKRYAFVGIILFVVGLVYGAVFNFHLQEGDVSIASSFMQGLFVGILSTTLFDLSRFCFGYLFYKPHFDKVEISLILYCKIGIVIVSASVIINFITNNGLLLTTLVCAPLLSISSLIYSIVIVDIGHYCGIYKFRTKRRKNNAKHTTTVNEQLI